MKKKSEKQNMNVKNMNKRKISGHYA